MLLKTSYTHRKRPLLESFFNKVAGLKAWNFIKKRLQHRYFPEILPNFSKNFICRTPPDDQSCWFLGSNQCFIHWSHFFLFSIGPVREEFLPEYFIPGVLLKGSDQSFDLYALFEYPLRIKIKGNWTNKPLSK